MASFLYLVAGVVIGLIAGWLIRGSRAGGAKPAAAPADSTPATVATPDAEPVVETEPVTEAELVAEPELLAGPEAEVEPAAETVDVVEAEIVEVDTVAVIVVEDETESEPAAVAVIETVTVIEPVAVEPVEAEPAAVVEASTVDTSVAAEPLSSEVPLETIPVPGASETDAVEAAPAPITVVKIAEPDNLTLVNGIGPKMAMALAVAGITTFRQLADTDVVTLRTAITNAGMRVAPTLPTWPDQAKRLAPTE